MKELKFEALWGRQVYAENVMVRTNRFDARVVDKVRKRVAVIEMSCWWMDNGAIKDAEKTAKYGSLRWVLKQQYLGYEAGVYAAFSAGEGGEGEEGVHFKLEWTSCRLSLKYISLYNTESAPFSTQKKKHFFV